MAKLQNCGLEKAKTKRMTMADEPDFLQKIESSWSNWHGTDEWSADKTVERFSLYDVPSRVDALDQLDAELSKAGTKI